MTPDEPLPNQIPEGDRKMGNDSDVASFLLDVKALRPGAHFDLLRKACIFTERAHEGEFRLSGELYFTHCLRVARTLAALGLDSVSIACGLLHDLEEDTHVRAEQIEEQFGKEVLDIVDGVTGVSALGFYSNEQSQKMLTLMVRDIRVVLVKLADRLQTMRWLASHAAGQRRVSAETGERLARETRDGFAPLAGRLGITTIQHELEDLSFLVLEPVAYGLSAERLAEPRRIMAADVDAIATPLQSVLGPKAIEAEVVGQPRNVYSIHQRTSAAPESEDPSDFFTIRITVQRVPECYSVLGFVHALFAPIPDRFGDFIDSPARNLHRYLRTTVIGPGGKPAELQIGTRETWRAVARGIAAYWWQTDVGIGETTRRERALWLTRVLDWFRGATDARAIIRFLETGCYPGEILVFSPTGERIVLPLGSTPVDFAYRSEPLTGDRCVGAKVNGRSVPLDHELASADIVDIATSDDAHPRRDWLKFVRTNEARSHIQKWLRARGYGHAVEAGLKIIKQDSRLAGGEPPSDEVLSDIARAMGCDSRDALFAALGFGDVTSEELFARLDSAKGSTGPASAASEPATVFISAKDEDREFAYPIYEFLTKQGFTVFFSAESLPKLGNADYRKEIDRALEQAKHLIIVASTRKNLDSSYVEAEWGVFINEKRGGRKAGNIITILAGTMTIDDLPPSLRYYHVIPFDPASIGQIIPYLK